ncbi:hypothetical protein WJR50_30185 [Catalinimonas sp. 4WD22]|uniref:hypothetical protein n=1 Tax=Catalinimonas locisalis TaxID=3133978 RepID=UPI0031013A0A
MAKKQPSDKLQRMMNIANRNKVDQSNQPDKKEEPPEDKSRRQSRIRLDLSGRRCEKIKHSQTIKYLVLWMIC